MKIKLSKSQWEDMGKKAGWVTAQSTNNEIESMIKLMQSLQEALVFHNNPEISNDEEEMNINFINGAVKDAEICLNNLKKSLRNDGFDIRDGTPPATPAAKPVIQEPDFRYPVQ